MRESQTTEFYSISLSIETTDLILNCFNQIHRKACTVKDTWKDINLNSSCIDSSGVDVHIGLDFGAFFCYLRKNVHLKYNCSTIGYQLEVIAFYVTKLYVQGDVSTIEFFVFDFFGKKYFCFTQFNIFK